MSLFESAYIEEPVVEVMTEPVPEPEDKEHIWIPQVTINPNYLVLWDKFQGTQNYNAEGLKDRNHDGEMSKKASKRVREIISWFTELSREKVHKHQDKRIKYRLTFATLTLSAAQQFDYGHDDEFIKRNLLNRFLQEAKRRWKVVNYFWRAEAQENGNIHFHITFDKYIHHSELRSTWNMIQADYGYIQKYRESRKQYFKDGFKYDTTAAHRTEEQQRKAYDQGIENNWSSPNSTDIHAISKMGNVGGYLAKYVSKNVFTYLLKGTELKAWKLKKIIKSAKNEQGERADISESLIAAHDTKEGIKIKFSATRLINLENYFEGEKIKVEQIVEVVTRPITGRLWFCSRTLKQLKNITLEITSEIYEAVQELISKSKARELIPKVKNKFTGELTDNRYVKVFIADFFGFKNNLDQTNDFISNVFNFFHSFKEDYVEPLFRNVLESLSGFFKAKEEDLILV